MHSTGVGVVERWKNHVELLKRPGPSQYLILLDEYRKIIGRPVKTLIGHNRYATIGAHTEENAHPFAFPKIVGAHNGTLDNHSRKLLFENEKYGTDSEAIFANINEFGIEETVKLLHGAWALTWFDAQENTINFLRNSKRPLYYCYSADRCTLIWASELEMLEYALKRHNQKSEGDSFFIVDADTHLSWKIPDNISAKLSAPTKVEMKGPPPPPVTTYRYTGSYAGGWRETDNRSQSYYDHQEKQRQTQGTTGASVIPFTTGATGGTPNTGSLFRTRVDTKKFRPPYKDSNNRIMNKKQFLELTAQGCVFCGENSSEWGEFIKPLKDQDGHQIYLCEMCYNDDDIYDLCANFLL